MSMMNALGIVYVAILKLFQRRYRRIYCAVFTLSRNRIAQTTLAMILLFNA